MTSSDAGEVASAPATPAGDITNSSDSPREDATADAAVVVASASEDRLAWVLLFAVASGALGGVAAQRLMLIHQRRQLQRDERPNPSEEQSVDMDSVD